jgi:glycosyltransferase involved in cell wall biosynthesis
MKDQNQQAEAPLRASICMATYNGSQYVEEQLESILAQLGPEDEIVIVDDASTDDTVARIRRFADPRIRLIAADANPG